LCDLFIRGDAEVVRHWLRKVERVMTPMPMPKESRVNCAAQLLAVSAHSWWETMRERRSREALMWRDFREEFEETYYSWKHRKENDQEFLNLQQRDINVFKYERRFQDLSIFASPYLPTEHHRVKRFRDGLLQELKMVLIAMPFQSIRELQQVDQGILKLVSE